MRRLWSPGGGRGEASDLVLVVAEPNRGWILDTVCKELAARFPGRALVHYGGPPFPRASAYFFSHWSLYALYRRETAVRRGRSLVFFTHPPDDPPAQAGLVRALRRCPKIVSMSSMHASWLLARGVPSESVVVAIPGVDAALFSRSPRGIRVGLNSAYYPRKNPSRVAALVEALPHRPFLLLGRGWQAAPEFARLASLANFTYVETSYDRYPEHYREMGVFVSPSSMEGGPMPLLEAMMSDVAPVASRTGFAPDLIKHGRNGWLFEVDAPTAEVAALVEAAFEADWDVRASVEGRTWEAFAATVFGELERVTGPGGR